VQNADGSLTVSGPSHYGDNITTLNIKAFGGGAYFEATCWYDNPNPGWHTDIGWPCFWMNSMEGRQIPFPDSRGIEVDIMEALTGSDNVFTGSVYDWYNSAGPSHNQAYGTDRITFPNGSNGHVSHRFGYLWVPATSTSKGYSRFYLDDVLIPSGNQTWDLYNPKAPYPYTKGTTLYGTHDLSHFYLMAGSGDPNPFTLKNVSVWQKDGSQNLPPDK
jgi:hypothetical protein